MSIKIMSRVWDLKNLTHTQKLVLLSLADNANDDGTCWPSIPMTAKRCSMSERNLQRLILSLGELGFLRKETRPGKSSFFHLTLEPSNPRQVVTPDTVSPLTQCHPTPDTVSPPGVTNTTFAINKEEPSIEPSVNHQKEKNTKKKISEVAEEAFQIWWSIYPRHISKKKARESFTTALKKIKLSRLIQKTKAFAEICAERETKPEFIPHPTTWLNGERWEDIPDPVEYETEEEALEAKRKARALEYFGPFPGGAMPKTPGGLIA